MEYIRIKQIIEAEIERFKEAADKIAVEMKKKGRNVKEAHSVATRNGGYISGLRRALLIIRSAKLTKS